MSFYDDNPNFYGSDPSRPAMPPRTDAMRDARGTFRHLMRQGALDPSSTLNARYGNSNLVASDAANPNQKSKIANLTTQVNTDPNYGQQPSYYTPAAGGLGPDLKHDQMQSFRDSLVNRFQNPGSGQLMPIAPDWMSSRRANNILEGVSGRFNNQLPYNANPYREQGGGGQQKGGQPA